MGGGIKILLGGGGLQVGGMSKFLTGGGTPLSHPSRENPGFWVSGIAFFPSL